MEALHPGFPGASHSQESSTGGIKLRPTHRVAAGRGTEADPQAVFHPGSHDFELRTWDMSNNVSTNCDEQEQKRGTIWFRGVRGSI